MIIFLQFYKLTKAIHSTVLKTTKSAQRCVPSKENRLARSINRKPHSIDVLRPLFSLVLKYQWFCRDITKIKLGTSKKIKKTLNRIFQESESLSAMIPSEIKCALRTISHLPFLRKKIFLQ